MRSKCALNKNNKNTNTNPRTQTQKLFKKKKLTKARNQRKPKQRMETQTQNQKQSQETLPQQQQQQNQKNMKKSSLKNSDSSAHYNDSPHSPLRFHSPLRSELDDPPKTPPYHSLEASPEKPPLDYSKAVVAVDKYTQFSPQ